MEQEDLDYFERRFDKIEEAMASTNKDHNARLNALQTKTDRHDLILTTAGTAGLAGFAAWVSSLFHK